MVPWCALLLFFTCKNAKINAKKISGTGPKVTVKLSAPNNHALMSLFTADNYAYGLQVTPAVAVSGLITGMQSTANMAALSVIVKTCTVQISGQ